MDGPVALTKRDFAMKHEPISALMQPHTRTIAADDPIEAVEAFLERHGLSWAPVLGDSGELLGVVSTADLMRARRTSLDPATTAAWRLCTYRPIAVSPTTTVGEVARLMIERHIHHVVVIERGIIRGCVSALDFVKTFV